MEPKSDTVEEPSSDSVSDITLSGPPVATPFAKEPRSDASDNDIGALAYDFLIKNSGVVVLHDSDNAAPVENSKARMAKDNEGVATGSTSAGDPRSDRTDDTDDTGGAPAENTRSVDSERDRTAPFPLVNMLVDNPLLTEDNDVPPAVH